MLRIDEDELRMTHAYFNQYYWGKKLPAKFTTAPTLTMQVGLHSAPMRCLAMDTLIQYGYRWM